MANDVTIRIDLKLIKREKYETEVRRAVLELETAKVSAVA